MSENKLLSKLRKDARKIARKFKLKLRKLELEHPRVRSRFGRCDESKTIRLRLHRLKDRNWISYPHLIHTLCHELAHLKFMNHSNEFKKFNKSILLWAKKAGIYKIKRNYG